MNPVFPDSTVKRTGMTGGTVRVCLLASGSKGNSIYVEAGDSRILIDAGLSARQIVSRLTAIGVSASDLDAIFISHEHTDHTRGAGTLSRKLKIPLVMSYPTASAYRETGGAAEMLEFESGYAFAFRGLFIDPFPITHDASDPVGFVIESGEGRVGIATDLGIVTGLVRDKLQKCMAVVLESNHDEEMLLNGPYPWHLKQRIRSRHGHLSNTQSADLLEAILHPRLEAVFLAHLSETNNDPAIARQVAENFLKEQNICAPQLMVGYQHTVSDLFTSLQ